MKKNATFLKKRLHPNYPHESNFPQKGHLQKQKKKGHTSGHPLLQNQQSPSINEKSPCKSPDLQELTEYSKRE